MFKMNLVTFLILCYVHQSQHYSLMDKLSQGLPQDTRDYTFYSAKKTYYVNMTVVPAQHALWSCESQGMRLVSIESADENEFIMSNLLNRLGPKAGGHFWTSANKTSDFYWEWMTTGKPVAYFNWAQGEPDNKGGNENCVALIKDDYHFTTRDNSSYRNRFGKWEDTDCYLSYYYICESNIL